MSDNQARLKRERQLIETACRIAPASRRHGQSATPRNFEVTGNDGETEYGHGCDLDALERELSDARDLGASITYAAIGRVLASRFDAYAVAEILGKARQTYEVVKREVEDDG